MTSLQTKNGVETFLNFVWPFTSELPLVFQNQCVFLPVQTQSIVWKGNLKKLETITSKNIFFGKLLTIVTVVQFMTLHFFS